MKVLNYGSLNYDHVYNVDHFVRPKESLPCLSYAKGYGGKGLNQSIALAKAGLEVYHAGKVGYDGQEFIDYLNSYNVHTDYLVKDNSLATGHAIIQVCEGQNCIVLHGGANQNIHTEEIDKTLAEFEAGDVLLLQNEINNMTYLINKAKDIGMYIAFNCAPMSKEVFDYPLDKIDLFVVNEIEGAELVKLNSSNYEEIIEELKKLHKEVIMTVGENGSYYIYNDTVIHEDALKVEAVDTTAAGDTFTGYFLAMKTAGKDISECLKIATKASSITVQGEGAANSIPDIKDLEL